MGSIIHDIIDDPGEYLPVFIFMAVLFLIWAGLCWSGFASLRAATRRRRLWFALVALVFGLMGVWAQMPLSVESEGFKLSFDFRWFFSVPLLLGIAGFVLWWRGRHQPLTQRVPEA